MRTLCLAVFLLAGCVARPDATPAAPDLDAPSASSAPSANASKADAASPAASPALVATYTADDEEIAKLVRAGADEAIAQIKLLNKMDPGTLEDVFLPLGTWIADTTARVDRYSPSSCTETAAALFVEAMDAYDDIRQTFLEWRDWGAHGHPFSPGAPPLIVKDLEAAVAELMVHCPAGSG